MSKNKSLLDKYDLSAVTAVFTGAAPLGAETAEDLHHQWPEWKILQAYGVTHVSKGTILLLLMLSQASRRQAHWSAQLQKTTSGTVHRGPYCPWSKLD